MQLDADDLKMMHDLANIRDLLSKRGSAALGEGRPIRSVMERRRDLLQQSDAIIDRFINKGLCAAGLPHAIDPATLLLPAVHRPMGPFLAPDPVLKAECDARRAPLQQRQCVALEIPTNHDK